MSGRIAVQILDLERDEPPRSILRFWHRENGQEFLLKEFTDSYDHATDCGNLLDDLDIAELMMFLCLDRIIGFDNLTQERLYSIEQDLKDWISLWGFPAVWRQRVDVCRALFPEDCTLFFSELPYQVRRHNYES